MPKNVQIRDLDDDVYAVLRSRAAAEDLSLARYLRRELRRLASVATMVELLEQADTWRAHHGGVSREGLDEAVEDMRAARDRLRD